jgi:peptidoglycan/xylan/chitin deacetylase (PgdA/CDA1 family)
MSNSILLRASRIAARHLLKDTLPLYGNSGVVSFTFDDAPASACTTGAAVLEKHGVRGTFYVAGGLTDRLEEGKPCHSEAQLKALLAAGHELGCHSYSHIHCDVLNSVVLSTELSRNATFLEELGVDSNHLNFAYPFGAYALGAKHICGTRFRSSRITGGGPHIGEADLQALKTFRLYEDPTANTGVTTFDAALALTAEHKGWLIINTHDIDDSPSRYGYTPAHLDEAISATIAAGCKIMTVSDAITYWQKNAHAVG